MAVVAQADRVAVKLDLAAKAVRAAPAVVKVVPVAVGRVAPAAAKAVVGLDAVAVAAVAVAAAKSSVGKWSAAMRAAGRFFRTEF